VRYLNDHSFTQEVVAGGHIYLSDESLAAGGDDLGPGPYELLLWALGACTAMTLLMYARRKEWPLAGVTIKLERARSSVEAIGAAERAQRADTISCEIDLSGELTGEQCSRLLQIADHCPVHRTLSDGATIVNELKRHE
jgi:putative redox protein